MINIKSRQWRFERITKMDTKERLKKFSDYLENSTIIFPIISYCSEEKFI